MGRTNSEHIKQRMRQELAVIAELQPCSRAQILARLPRVTPKQLLHDLLALREAGHVTMHDARTTARYSIAQDHHERETDRSGRPDPTGGPAARLRASVLEAIRTDPAALNDTRLALALNEDINRVYAATTDLLAGELITQHEDTTFSPAT